MRRNRSCALPAALLLCCLGMSNPAQAHSVNGWLTSANGTSSWTKINSSSFPLEDFAFADFDGNGRTDVFLGTGSVWLVSFDGTSTWNKINESVFKAEALRFGNFDGDTKVDIFRADGSGWWVSFDGISKWNKIGDSKFSISALKLGDFNGNGRTDVFRADGSGWWVSFDGTSPWTKINGSKFGNSSLALGDFDGNGKSDVFRADGEHWWVSRDGIEDWKLLNNSVFDLSFIRFGNFDGDTRTDIFRADGSRWWVSFDGTSQWTEINNSSYKLSALRFGNFVGDARTDVFGLQAETHVSFRPRRFTSSSLTNGQVDGIMPSMGTLLQVNDGPGDRPCLVHFSRAETVTTFSTGDGSIDSSLEFSAVDALPGNAKVVNQINWCSGIKPNIIGCSPTPGKSIVVVRLSGLEEILWAHEYGHTRGLGHRKDVNAIMNEFLVSTARRVNATECAAFRK